MSQPHKICPQCQTPAELQAPQCARCGRVYRTQFPQGQVDPSVTGTHTQPPVYAAPPQMPPSYPVGNAYYPPAPVTNSNVIQLPAGVQLPGLALFFAFFLLGGGQFYNRQFYKGIAVYLGYLAVTFTLWFIAFVTLGIGMVLFVVLIPIWVATMVDAYQIAQRLKRGEPVGQWQWF